MPSDVLTAVRQRYSVFGLVAWVLVTSGVYLWTNNPALVLGIGTGFAITESMRILQSTPSVDERWFKAAVGAAMAVGGAGWVWYRLTATPASGSLWVPVFAVVGGFWVVLDARADFLQGRRFGADDDMDALDELAAGEAMLVMQHVGVVADELQDDPKTIEELATACDLTESRIREAIEVASHEGTIYQVESDPADDPTYAVDDQKVGASGLGRVAANGVGRITRPVVSLF